MSVPGWEDDDLLPEQTDDDLDVGWGERPEDPDADDAAWLRRERPPHHGD